MFVSGSETTTGNTGRIRIGILPVTCKKQTQKFAQRTSAELAQSLTSTFTLCASVTSAFGMVTSITPLRYVAFAWSAFTSDGRA